MWASNTTNFGNLRPSVKNTGESIRRNKNVYDPTKEAYAIWQGWYNERDRVSGNWIRTPELQHWPTAGELRPGTQVCYTTEHTSLPSKSALCLPRRTSPKCRGHQCTAPKNPKAPTRAWHVRRRKTPLLVVVVAGSLIYPPPPPAQRFCNPAKRFYSSNRRGRPWSTPVMHDGALRFKSSLLFFRPPLCSCAVAQMPDWVLLRGTRSLFPSLRCRNVFPICPVCFPPEFSVLLSVALRSTAA